MVREALTGYWTLVSGLTEVTVERARAAARSMLAQGEATREQVSGLAQEIIETSRTNREALVKLVRFETERAAGRLGFASTDEVTTLQGRVRELERSVAELRAATDPVAEPAAAKAGPARKAAKAPARKPAEPPAEAAPKAAKAAGPPAKAARAKKAPRTLAAGGPS
jgi:polyhydroxyalkanoate synthesis regulator phasin